MVVCDKALMFDLMMPLMIGKRLFRKMLLYKRRLYFGVRVSISSFKMVKYL